jgi:hypothetical protein
MDFDPNRVIAASFSKIHHFPADFSRGDLIVFIRFR